MKISSFILTFLCLIFLLIACSPIYEETFYDEEEFIRDSSKIVEGKYKRPLLKERGERGEEDLEGCFMRKEETLQEGDCFTLLLHCPKRPEGVSAAEQINQQMGFVVSQGQLSLPYIGSVEAEGLTLIELKEKIQACYRSFFPDIQVFLNFKTRKERFVSIIGAKNSVIPIRGESSLSQVLAQAELPPFCNLHHSYVMRQGEKLPVDLYQLIYEGSETDNIPLRGGDQIFIANGEEEVVMVTGEVAQPGLIHIPPGGISLREALGQAGGLPFTGSRDDLQVIRGGFSPTKVYLISWDQMLSLSHDSLLLMPGDVVVVPTRPITQWNRWINGLQPSLTAVQTGHAIYNFSD